MATPEANATVNSNENSNAQNNNKEDNNSNSREATPRTGPHTVMTPTSPAYPPYGIYIDPAQLAANGYDVSDPANFTTYVYPVSPQFSVQYYPDYSNGYQSYPGSPSLHPQSPPINPASPPFSPTFQYHQGGIALSPPTHAYMLPPHATQSFPPLHISSPVLTGTNSIPGSPPHQYLPGPYVIHQTDNKRYYSRQRKEQQDDEGIYHTNNVYVRGLPPSTTDESFLEMCQVYGTVTSSKAIIDQKTHECKGYGFVMFEKEKECEDAIEGLSNSGFQASYAKIGQESFSSRLRHLQDETSTNIYISNLPLETTERSLEELFQPYQTVSNRILRDPRSGLSRGVGFARMTDREAASAIIEKFNGMTIDGCTAPLQVRFADSPAQKKLKNQTGRKRVVRPGEFQPVATFAMRPMMPITPETMLGIASPPHGFYTDPYLRQPPFAAQIIPKPGTSKQSQEESVLVEELDKLNVSEA